MINNDILSNSKSYKLFSKEMIKNKVLRDSLIAFEEILGVKKNIRIMFNTDDPFKIKKIIGNDINGNKVTEKDYNYVLLIDNTYKNLHSKCKFLLNKK